MSNLSKFMEENKPETSSGQSEQETLANTSPSETASPEAPQNAIMARSNVSRAFLR